MKILLANLHKYTGYSGGIEHVLSQMAFAIAERGHEVSIVMADEKDGTPFYALPASCHFYNIFHMNGMKPVSLSFMDKAVREISRVFSKEAARNQNYRMLLKGKTALERVISLEKPDVIISFREPTGRLLLDGIGTSIPVITMLHNDPDEIFAHSPEAEKKALEKSAAIQVLMPSFIQKAKKYISCDSFVHIPNSVSPAKVISDPGMEKKVHTITNVGRVTGRTKRQHLLVEAFSLIAKDYPDWEVDIWGDTYDKAYVTTLKQLIKKRNLQQQVHLRGTTKDMASVWEKTDIFAFPSHHEGFGLALAEAMSAGIPAVGYKNCPAVNELIHDGEDGYLTDDGPHPFSLALKQLMSDSEKRRTFGRKARENMKSYSPEIVFGQWDDLIHKVTKK